MGLISQPTTDAIDAIGAGDAIDAADAVHVADAMADIVTAAATVAANDLSASRQGFCAPTAVAASGVDLCGGLPAVAAQRNLSMRPVRSASRVATYFCGSNVEPTSRNPIHGSDGLRLSAFLLF